MAAKLDRESQLDQPVISPLHTLQDTGPVSELRGLLSTWAGGSSGGRTESLAVQVRHSKHLKLFAVFYFFLSAPPAASSLGIMACALRGSQGQVKM